MGISQDRIGWRRFTEGIISKETVKLQKDFADLGGYSVSLDKWAQEIVVWLLEVTHGQWLYRNMHVHDATAGTEETTRKEEMQRFIKDQLEMEGEELDKMDHYLPEINLEDLKISTGGEQHYCCFRLRQSGVSLRYEGRTMTAIDGIT